MLCSMPSMGRRSRSARMITSRAGQRPRIESALGHERLEAGPLLLCGPSRGAEPPGVGQAGPDQVDGTAEPGVGLRLESVGPGEALVELALGWSQGRHDREGAAHAQLVRAVTAAP